VREKRWNPCFFAKIYVLFKQIQCHIWIHISWTELFIYSLLWRDKIQHIKRHYRHIHSFMINYYFTSFYYVYRLPLIAHNCGSRNDGQVICWGQMITLLKAFYCDLSTLTGNDRVEATQRVFLRSFLKGTAAFCWFLSARIFSSQRWAWHLLIARYGNLGVYRFRKKWVNSSDLLQNVPKNSLKSKNAIVFLTHSQPLLGCQFGFPWHQPTGTQSQTTGSMVRPLTFDYAGT